jgi:small subunit ribosomal protein S4e
LLKNRLKLALNANEAKIIVKAKEGNIAIDGKVRKDVRYPVGFMDVLTILKTGAHYRVLYDVKGRFDLVKISANEAETKLCRVKERLMGPKNIPYIVTHDGRTIRFPNPQIKKGDTIKLNLKDHSISNVYKFENEALVMITGGNNIGRIGKINKIETHPSSYDIIYVTDSRNNVFNTRSSNVFVIGTKKPEITDLGRHTHFDILEEKALKAGKRVENDEE